MSGKKTMTLNLTEAEMAALDDLATRKDLTKTSVIRQAIRLYQLVDAKVSQGEKVFFEGGPAKATKAELVLL